MINLQNVSKKYGTGNTALEDISFVINPGEFVFLVGPSGSGKTTLFRLLIKELAPTSGSIHIGEWDIVNLPNNKLSTLRQKIGVVFQDLKLLRDQTIFENVLFPLEVANTSERRAKERVEEILQQVGIAEHRDKFPVQLSGGELQRAAIARALAFSPEILLADEPTGNLDDFNTGEIVKLLQSINDAGTTIIMATHDTDIVNKLKKRTIALDKGRLIRDASHSTSSGQANKEKEKK